ncbi:MAG: hypothetical protein U0M99_06535 [Oscillospiraceae bacterium]|nr:hypothetical protein [Oscillibacter sp.]
MNIEVFVQNVKHYCSLKGVKPTVACEESGAGKNLLSQMIHRGSLPTVARVQLLAQYLGCTVSDLLGEESPENAKAAAPEGSGLSEEFARIFAGLTPENQNVIIAEMLRRQREQ